MVVVCANSGEDGEDRRRDWWREREVKRGERMASKRVVNWAEMVEGKMRVEARRARAEWTHKGRNTVLSIWME